MSKFIQMHWTCAEIEEARKIAYALVEKRLVACVNIIPAIESIYTWEGKIQVDQEALVLLKTKASLFEEVKTYIEIQGSYDVPAILSFPILEGNSNYLSWLENSLR